MWVDGNDPSKAIPSDQKSVPVLLSQSNIPNHVRQAALAARKLGEGVFDGMDAVTSGLAKRGVVQTYVMIEGCAKELGCTAIVRVRRSCNNSVYASFIDLSFSFYSLSRREHLGQH